MKERITSASIKTERTGIVSTAAEKAAWEIAAIKDNRSLSDWMRQVCNAAAIEAGTMLPKPEGGNAVPVLGVGTAYYE